MKRIIEISTRGTSLTLRQSSLVFRVDQDERAIVPIGDLGALIIADRAVSLSAAALSALAAKGGVTIFCGLDHMPEGALLPLRAHSTRGERVAAQFGASQPLKKQLWARIVAAKIRSQAVLLDERSGRRALENHAASVRSGDPDNREAQAARLYWPLVFANAHPDFGDAAFRRRDPSHWPNALLNYGYAILRAITARALCAAGLMPEVGVHHHNRYDHFALASDLMEPFRPWVDLAVMEVLDMGPGELDRERKQALLGIYERPAFVDSGRTPLWLAIQACASQLAQAFLAAKDGASAPQAAAKLQFPSPFEADAG